MLHTINPSPLIVIPMQSSQRAMHRGWRTSSAELRPCSHAPTSARQEDASVNTDHQTAIQPSCPSETFTHQDIVTIFHHLRHHAAPGEYLKLNLNARTIVYQYPHAVMEGDRSIEFGSLHHHQSPRPCQSPWHQIDAIRDSDDDDDDDDDVALNHIKCLQHDHSDWHDPIDDDQDLDTTLMSTPAWSQHHLDHDRDWPCHATPESDMLSLDASNHDHVDDVDDPWSTAQPQPNHTSTVKIYFRDDHVSLNRWWPEERAQVLDMIQSCMSDKKIHFVEAKRQSMSAHLDNLIIPSSITHYAPKAKRRQSRHYTKLIDVFTAPTRTHAHAH